ncbi:MAG: MATE family efflux transporter, partial [Oscillospiraceae bacterium]|nr:MATE family efflux transporter [Oscillospiraceae bacterium]
MANWIGGLFAAEKLLPAPERIGDIPTTRETYKNLINIALPSVMELVLVSMMASVDTMMVGGNSPAAIAATGLTGQPRMLILCIFFALNIGVTAVVARRRGEERQGKANEALRNALVIILLVALVLMAAVLPFTRPLMRLAGAKDDTVDMAAQYFIIVSSVLPLNAATLCINAAQRGVGNTRITMYVNLLSNGVNIFLNFVLINGYLGFPQLGVLGAAIATAIGFVAGFFLSLYSVVSHKSVGRFLHINILHDDWRLHKDTLQAIGKVGGNAMLEQVALRVGFFLYARLVADLGTISFAAHQVCQQFLNLSFNFGDGIGVASTSLVGQMLGRKRPDLAKL